MDSYLPIASTAATVAFFCLDKKETKKSSRKKPSTHRPAPGPVFLQAFTRLTSVTRNFFTANYPVVLWDHDRADWHEDYCISFRSLIKKLDIEDKKSWENPDGE